MATWIPQRPATGRLHREQQTTAVLAVGQSAPVTFSALGRAGFLVAASSSQLAWLTLYSSEAARTADAERVITADPPSGSGVLLDAVLEPDQELLLPPGCTFFNAEDPGDAALYALVRRHSGSGEAAAVTVQLRAMVLAL